jgi:hypothetical protein
MGTLAWRCGGQLSITVVVKATFRLASGQPMTVTTPQPVLTRDEPSGALLSSPRAPSDLAPQLRKVDVVLFGSAHAPPAAAGRGATTTEMTVRLAVGRDDRVLLDKALRVVGDRHGGSPPAPFERMPIVYERAFGGPDVSDNPIGVGTARRTGPRPNVLAPGGTSETVAGYGPLPLFFLSRAKLLGAHSREALRRPTLDIPIDFDWDYFQSAPEDQRIGALHGDEWLELTGLSPNHHHLRTWLPRARAVARVYGGDLAAVPDSVPLSADLVLVEPDEHSCSVTWRGSFPLSDPQHAGELVIAGGLEHPGVAVAWPQSREAALAQSRAPGVPTQGPPTVDETLSTAVYDPHRDPSSYDASTEVSTDVYVPRPRPVAPPSAPKTPDEETFIIHSDELVESAAHAGDIEVLPAAAGQRDGDGPDEPRTSVLSSEVVEQAAADDDDELDGPRTRVIHDQAAADAPVEDDDDDELDGPRTFVMHDRASPAAGPQAHEPADVQTSLLSAEALANAAASAATPFAPAPQIANGELDDDKPTNVLDPAMSTELGLDVERKLAKLKKPGPKGGNQ